MILKDVPGKKSEVSELSSELPFSELELSQSVVFERSLKVEMLEFFEVAEQMVGRKIPINRRNVSANAIVNFMNIVFVLIVVFNILIQR